MALFPATCNDEQFKHRDYAADASFYTRRSSLCRWVWVSNTFRVIWERTTAHIVDDFGSLVEIKYVGVSLAGSKDPI